MAHSARCQNYPALCELNLEGGVEYEDRDTGSWADLMLNPLPQQPADQLDILGRAIELIRDESD